MSGSGGPAAGGEFTSIAVGGAGAPGSAASAAAASPFVRWESDGRPPALGARQASTRGGPGAGRGGPAFVRQLSAQLNMPLADEPVVETFDCPICFIAKAVEDRYRLPACTHEAACCRDCFRAHLEYEINRGGNVLRVLCPCSLPDGSACQTVVPDDVIGSLVAPATLERFQRLRILRSDDQARECPKCHAVQPGGSGGTAENPIMTCTSCHAHFCFLHNDAHEPTMEACRAYKLRTLRDEQQTRALLDQIAMRCPGCNVPIQKHNGCNHMTCASATCHQEFCWLCGMTITGQVMWHYDNANPAGCPGMMFQDGAPNSRRELVQRALERANTFEGKCESFTKGLIYLVFWPVILALMLVFVALGCCCCVICLPCAACFAFSDSDMRDISVVILVLPLLPLFYLVLYTRGIFRLLCCSSAPNMDITSAVGALIADDTRPDAPPRAAPTAVPTFARPGGWGVADEAAGGGSGGAAAAAAGGAGGAKAPSTSLLASSPAPTYGATPSSAGASDTRNPLLALQEQA